MIELKHALDLKHAGGLKTLPIEFDAKTIGDDGSFEGYASKFGIVDQGCDVVLAGAFTKSLQETPAERVRMLWQHRPDEPIGIWPSIVEDSIGLKVSGQLNLDVQRGREARSLMRMGALDGLSIGFMTIDCDYAKPGIRQLKEVSLREISVVTFPMLQAATVTAVKDFDPRELEASLRDAGLSRNDAVKAVAIFRKSQREAAPPQADDPRDAGQAIDATKLVAVMQRLEQSLRA